MTGAGASGSRLVGIGPPIAEGGSTGGEGPDRDPDDCGEVTASLTLTHSKVWRCVRSVACDRWNSFEQLAEPVTVMPGVPERGRVALGNGPTGVCKVPAGVCALLPQVPVQVTSPVTLTGPVPR